MVSEFLSPSTGTNLTGLGMDSYLTRKDGTTETFPLTDHLGSVIALTDATGAIVTNYTYEPYGATTQTGTVSANPHQYTGRENDGTGLYFYRARYYDPQLMRFISEDPIGLAGGLNSYAYVDGDPISLKDPKGLLFMTTINGAGRMTLNEAVHSGAPGTLAAQLAGGLTPPAVLVGGAGGAAAAEYFSLPSAIRIALGLIKGLQTDGVPPPEPPAFPPRPGQMVCRPGDAAPPPQPPRAR